MAALTKEVPCPQCGSWDRRTILKEEDRFIVKCRRCRLMFTSPQLTDEARVQALNTDYQPAPLQEQYEAITLRERRRVAMTTRFLKGRQGKWLDVGCAAGVLLSEAEKGGFVPFGFEVRAEYAKQLRDSRGWDVRTADSLAKALFPTHAFDVVSLLDTLYYMPDPVGELRVMKDLLAPDGVLMCRVANARYLLLKNTGLIAYLRFGRWSHMNTDFYLIHFTAQSLRSVLKKAGFRIIHQEAGKPWMAGSPLNLFFKSSWFRVAQFLRLLGIDLGVAIDVWAVPA